MLMKDIHSFLNTSFNTIMGRYYNRNPIEFVGRLVNKKSS